MLKISAPVLLPESSVAQKVLKVSLKTPSSLPHPGGNKALSASYFTTLAASEDAYYVVKRSWILTDSAFHGSF